MTKSSIAKFAKHVAIALFVAFSVSIHAQSCTVLPVEFRGWKAQQVSNAWVKLTVVPQLGGRLMQVEFEGHPYLFVNPRYEGKYIPPEQAAGRWINYGGDKIWPMPEGNEDEEHWVLESGTLDDSPYSFRVLEQGQRCTIELSGPADETTGLSYTREITLEAHSPAIRFHAVMHNATSHTLRWSVQSVSQYNLASATSAGGYNHKFWAYSAVNPGSAYLGGFHVRAGLVDDPSFSVKDNLFRLHWMYFENEVWIDSHEGWLAIADGESGYGMMERFTFNPTATYPDNATVIFYKNGPSVEFDASGDPEISKHSPEETPYYMEAEINSPLVTLPAGSSASLDTTWYPMRTGATVKRITEAGIVTQRLQALRDASGLKISGSFSVAVPGHLQLRLYGSGGRDAKHVQIDEAGPENPIMLNRNVPIDFAVSRISLHLIDANGADWGILDEAAVNQPGGEN